MGIGVGINGGNSGYIGVVPIVDYFPTLSFLSFSRNNMNGFWFLSNKTLGNFYVKFWLTLF